MSIQRTNLFNTTVEGEKQLCSKCKRERKVIGMKLIQKKRGKYEIILKQRCSFDCKGNQDKVYPLKTQVDEKEDDALTVEEVKEVSLGNQLDQAIKETEEEEALVFDPKSEIKELPEEPMIKVVEDENGVIEIPLTLISAKKEHVDVPVKVEIEEVEEEEKE